MKFCTVCSNMLYISLGEDGNTTSYYCRKCGTIDSTAMEEGVCVLKTELKKRRTKIQPYY